MEWIQSDDERPGALSAALRWSLGKLLVTMPRHTSKTCAGPKSRALTGPARPL